MTDPSTGGPANPWPPTPGPAGPPVYPPQVSAVPAGVDPAAFAPVSGTALLPVAVAPRAKTSPWVWVLAALSVVLLLSAGGVGALYATTSKDNDKRVADKASIIDADTAKADELAKTKSDLSKQVDDAKADVTKAQQTLDSLNKCQDAIQAFGAANAAASGGTGTRAAADAAFSAMVVACGAH